LSEEVSEYDEKNIDESLSALEELENAEEAIEENLEEEKSDDETISLTESSLNELESEPLEENIEKTPTEDNNELSLDKYTLIELEDGTKVKRTSYAKDNIDVEDAVFSDEQNYVVQHIYSEEQDILMKEVSEKDALTEEELESIDCVEEFDLSSLFNNQPVDNNINDNEEEIEVPDLYDDNSVVIDNDDSLAINEDLELPEIDDEEPKEVDLIKEDNLKEDEINIQYNDRNVVVPDIDNVDYIDESNYINEIDNDDDVIQLSGNELDLITKDFEINNIESPKEEDITDDYREDNYTMSEISDGDLEEIDDGYINENEEDIIDDYRENNYTMSEISDGDLEEIDDGYINENEED
ncbi:hypothetical protein JQ833_13195, partial [Brachyspira hyodysenteriae]|nr:hypothetical protein [Brachyspira hyodysenteriae]MBT8736541.1 hypothetical protein [Brachyspira hyodysenteriae]MBT8749449.1 hypothetical protein [Brachyspira hyodysenteriae]MBT8752024.1 hypothetical protein [Brachyspira hyodysenteriae]MBT8754606.1 hypothetical protein [Brachyspira hyodysenteriae]